MIPLYLQTKYSMSYTYNCVLTELSVSRLGLSKMHFPLPIVAAVAANTN